MQEDVHVQVRRFRSAIWGKELENSIQLATMYIFKGSIDESLENLCDFWEHHHDPNVGFFLL